MPKREDQNDPLLDKILGGRDQKGRFLPKGVVQAVQQLHDSTAKYRKIGEATTKQVHKLNKQLLKSNQATLKQAKAVQLANKSTIDALKRNNALIQGKVRLQAKTIQLTQRLRDQRREMERNTRAGRGFALSLRNIGIAGAAYAGARRFGDSISRQLDAAVIGGPDILKRIGPLPSGGIAGDKLLASIGKIVSESQTLRFSASDTELQGITKAVNDIRGIGTERASGLISDFVGTLEPQLQRAFAGAVNQSGLKSALGQFQNLGNVDLATSIANAIEFKTQSEQGKLDPILEAAKVANQSLQELDKAFIDVANSLTKTVLPALQKFNDLSSSTKSGLVVGGAVTALVGSSALRIPGVGKGIVTGSKFAGKGIARGGRGLVGLGGRGLSGVQGLAARGVGAAGSGLTALNGIGLTGAAGVAGVATGVGIPAIIAAGLIRQESERASRDFQSVLDSMGGSNGLDALARGTPRDSERNKLKADKRKLEAILGGIRPAGTTGSLLLGQVPSGEYTAEQEKQIAKLRESIRAIQDQIRTIDSAKTKQSQQTEAIAESVQAVKNLSGTTNELTDLQRRAVKLEELQLPRELQSSVTALARQQKDLASIGPFQTLGAFSEIQAVNQSLQKEIEVLNKILALQDESTTRGQIQANELRTQIVGLRTEQKSNLRSLQTAFLDSALSQAFGANGHFSKIVLNQERALGIQLRKGLVGVDPFIRQKLAGNIDPNRAPAHSVRGLDVLRMAQPSPSKKQIRVSSQQPDMGTLLRSTAKAFGKAADLIDQDSPMGVETEYQQNRLGSVNPPS